MPELKITSSRAVVTIETDVYLESSHALVQTLARDLDTLDAAIQLDKLTADKLTDTPLEYSYEFKGKDGRKFYQSFLFDNGVKQAIDTFGFRWDEAKEFAFHRPIRGAVIALVRDYKLVKLKAVY